MFNKRTLCVEESVHVLFDESNSLIEDDAQDDDFELGLARKDLLPTQEESKNSQEGSGTGSDSKTEGQGFEQIGKLQQSPVWNRKPQTIQKQALEQAQKQDVELFLSQDHQTIRLRIDLLLEHGSIKNLTPLIKVLLI